MIFAFCHFHFQNISKGATSRLAAGPNFAFGKFLSKSCKFKKKFKIDKGRYGTVLQGFKVSSNLFFCYLVTKRVHIDK